jgi:hypothetical protein
MKRLLLGLSMLAAVGACSSRGVVVESAPAPTPSAVLTVSNDLDQAVNVYVVSGSTDHFVKQVAAKSTEALNVSNVEVGSTVRLKATTADGTKTYTKDGVTLQAATSWKVP